MAAVRWVRRRLRLSDPAALCGAVRGYPEAAMILYRANLTVLAHLGQAPMGGETPAAFAARAAEQFNNGAFAEFAAAVSDASYGRKPLKREDIDLRAVEIDRESVDYLYVHFPALGGRLIQGDFLRLPLERLFPGPVHIIGNFPYNISSQIFFKVIDNRERVPQVVCMIQKEVAERIAEKPGTKTYGILSVLLQAWYDIEYLFTVGEGAFNPPPKVKSAVIRLTRNGRESLECDEAFFKKVVKTAFGQRRKTLRNSLKPLLPEGADTSDPVFDLRPERLGVEDFIRLTRMVSLSIQA